MTRILTDISFIKNPVSASTPPSGFGTVYASGSDLYFRNDAGTIHNLTSNVIIREYTVDSTWTRPAGIKEIFVLCVGAGGGAGSGARGATAPGGSGGGGGALVWLRIPASDIIENTVSIVIGAGGNGGARRSAASNGQNGSSGGDTSFGTYVVADGGGSGSGGISGGNITPNGTGGTLAGSTPSTYPYSIAGANGGVGNRGTVAGVGLNGLAAPGGGGGGGISGGTTNGTGGRGGGILSGSTFIQGGAGGVLVEATGSSGIDDVCKTLLFTLTETIYGIGTGGGGGASSVGGQSGDGGSGGRCAGGGGGAGGTSISGAGGAGGNGLCIVTEYY